MSSWQGIEIDAGPRQLAEHAAHRAGIPVEQLIERAIRRAYPAAFQAPQPAPALTMTPTQLGGAVVRPVRVARRRA